MKASKTCERCGEVYQIEPNLKFVSKYCPRCRKGLRK